jgi:hypothetical protein
MNPLYLASLQPWIFECVDKTTKQKIRVERIGEINSLVDEILEQDYVIEDFYIKPEEQEK